MLELLCSTVTYGTGYDPGHTIYFGLVRNAHALLLDGKMSQDTQPYSTEYHRYCMFDSPLYPEGYCRGKQRE